MALSSMDTEHQGSGPRRQCDWMAENKDIKKLAACDLESAGTCGLKEPFWDSSALMFSMKLIVMHACSAYL